MKRINEKSTSYSEPWAMKKNGVEVEGCLFSHYFVPAQSIILSSPRGQDLGMPPSTSNKVLLSDKASFPCNNDNCPISTAHCPDPVLVLDR